MIFVKERNVFIIRGPNKDKGRWQNAFTRIPKSLSSEKINTTEKEIISKLHSLCVYYSRQRNKQEYSLKSEAAANDVYRSKWTYHLWFLNDYRQPRKTTWNLTTVDDDECGPSPASSVFSKTNSKRPTPKKKGSKDKKSLEIQFKKYATAYMKKMTEQTDKETKTEDEKFCKMIAKKFKKMQEGATKEYLELETGFNGWICYTATIVTVTIASNVLRVFGNLNSFYFSKPYNSATRDKSPFKKHQLCKPFS